VKSDNATPGLSHSHLCPPEASSILTNWDYNVLCTHDSPFTPLIALNSCSAPGKVFLPWILSYSDWSSKARWSCQTPASMWLQPQISVICSGRLCRTPTCTKLLWDLCKHRGWQGVEKTTSKRIIHCGNELDDVLDCNREKDFRQHDLIGVLQGGDM
jgi:hypothetical protein